MEIRSRKADGIVPNTNAYFTARSARDAEYAEKIILCALFVSNEHCERAVKFLDKILINKRHWNRSTYLA